MYLLPPGPLLCKIRFLLTPLLLCFLLRCLLLSLPVPVPATAIAVFPANRPSLSQLGPLPQRTPAPAFEPCSVPLLLSPWGSLRATAKNPGVLQSMGLRRVGHDRVMELN